MIQLFTLNAVVVIKQASVTWENELRLIYASFFLFIITIINIIKCYDFVSMIDRKEYTTHSPY
jgi:hypothetical protein